MLTQGQAVEIRILARHRESIRPSKLDPYTAYVEARIGQARPDWIPATVPQAESSFANFLGSVLTAEWTARTERVRQRLLQRATLRFIDRAVIIVLLAPSGVGKAAVPR